MRVGDGSARDGKLSTEPLEKLLGRQQENRGEDRASAPKASADEPSPFARILRGLGREVDRGEDLVKQAIRGPIGGQDLGSGELLALQAGVYRYSEAVDLSAKLVDRASSGVKTVLQGQ